MSTRNSRATTDLFDRLRAFTDQLVSGRGVQLSISIILIVMFPGAAEAQPYSVEGVVLDLEGPVAGVLIRFSLVEGDGNLSESEATSDATGSFSGSFAPGTLRIHAIPPTSAGLTEEQTELELERDSRVRLRLERAVPLRAEVRNQGGSLVPASVELWNLVEDFPIFADAPNGILDDPIPAGMYSIQAIPNDPFLAPGRRNVDLQSAMSVVVSVGGREEELLPEKPPDAALIVITEPDQDCRVIVTGAAGSVEGLSTVMVANLNTLQVNYAVSDPDGSFSLPVFAPYGSSLQVSYDPTGRFLPNSSRALSGFVEGPPATIFYVEPPQTVDGISIGSISHIDLDTALSERPPFAEFHELGTLDAGQWWIEATVSRLEWMPGEMVSISGVLYLQSNDIGTHPEPSAITANPSVRLQMLFDRKGWRHQTVHQFSSSLLSPTGFPIEQDAGDGHQIDSRWEIGPFEAVAPGRLMASASGAFTLPGNLKPGYYRPVIKLEVGGLSPSAVFFDIPPVLGGVDPALGYLPLIQVGSPESARLNWAMLLDEFSGGARGIVAREDAERFQLANHVVLAPERFVLPMRDLRTGELHSYHLEPYLPMVSYSGGGLPATPAVPFRFPSGSLSVTITKPDGSAETLVGESFVQSASRYPSSRRAVPISDFTAHAADVYQLITGEPAFEYSFTQYGDHTIEVSGSIEDVWGNQFRGGGTYEVTVARPVSIEPAVFPGTPFEVGNIFTGSVTLHPGVAADVKGQVTLLRESSPDNVLRRSFSGRASRFGYSSPGSWVDLDGPGEYRVDLEASYVVDDGVVWFGAMSSACVVETPNSSIITHGRRGFDQGQTIEPQWFFFRDSPRNGTHVMYAFHTGDVMWFEDSTPVSNASMPKITVQDPSDELADRIRERSGSAKIESPDLEDRIAGGEIPLFISAPDGIEPSFDPEIIDRWGYFYASAQRPGVRVRELLSQDFSGFGYWRFAENYQFQPGVGVNGDLPNDFKFQFGGAVYREPEEEFFYYGAYGSLFVLLPEEEREEGRVFPPFQAAAGGPSGGPIMTLKGKEIDIFFHPTGVRGGTLLEVGNIASFAGQIGPTLPSKVEIEITSPSGKQRSVAGQANKVGYFYDPSKDFQVDEPGRWTADVRVWHDGMTSAGPVQQPPFPEGDVLGSRDGELYFYVVERDAPSLGFAISAPGGLAEERSLLRTLSADEWLDGFVRPAEGPIDFTIDAPDGLSDLELCTTTVMPGFILEEICDESLSYRYDATALHEDFPNLDLFDADGFAGVDTITFSFFLSGTDELGKRRHFARSVLLQGEQLIAPSQHPNLCVTGGELLCLNDDRFEVRVEWKDFQGETGTGQAEQLTPDTGYFWFFSPDNVELVLKVLDGRSFNDHFWVFYGSLSNVEYTITVTDTWTGMKRRYEKPLGEFASVGDTGAFPGGTIPVNGTKTGTSSPPRGSSSLRAETVSEDRCMPSSTALCLNDDRFRIEVIWRDFQGSSGAGQAVPLTADTGTFWFFDRENVELILKVLDGRAINGHFWVFYGALSNVEYTITVTDTETGATRQYTNPSGQFASFGDTAAF